MSRKSSRLHLIKPRVGNVRPRVSVMDVDYEAVSDPGYLERVALYRSKRWASVRGRALQSRCQVPGCEGRASALDHLLGHNDELAVQAMRVLGIPADSDWRVRFWRGPFLSLCYSHHNKKTGREKQGQLLGWLSEYLSTDKKSA